jgi:hypothetical protein
MYTPAKRILQDVAGSAGARTADVVLQHRKLIGGAGAGAAAVAGPLLFNRSFDLGHEAYSFGRRALNLRDMVRNSEEDSKESRHRQRILRNAVRRADAGLHALGPAGSAMVKESAGHKDSEGVKAISFPLAELGRLRGREHIVTTRVSDDYGRLQQGDAVRAPWGALYRITSRQRIGSPGEHPFKQRLNFEQKDLLGRYRRIAVLGLDRVSR